MAAKKLPPDCVHCRVKKCSVVQPQGREYTPTSLYPSAEIMGNNQAGQPRKLLESSSPLQRQAAQPKRVHNDGGGTERHRSCGQHRAHQKPKDRVKDSRGDRHSKDVVKEREKQV